ncbi:hypothetical protein F66182_3819 [Fusarium sp. NRRL 66182]|nr:hypothetical protein F66182_3819 [Fusarium sp. NRRL 66182]
MGANYPAPKAPQYLCSSLPVPNCTPISPSPLGDKSVSGISSALHHQENDLWRDDSLETAISTPDIAIPITPPLYTTAPSELFVSPRDLTISAHDFSPAYPPGSDPPTLLKTTASAAPFNRSLPTAQQVVKSPMIEYTDSYGLRHKLGRASMLRLQRRCERIARVCDHHGHLGDYDDILHQCADPWMIWQVGFESLRNVLRNKPPPGLVGILQALVVADALICQVPDAKEREKEFILDLRRWKVLLCEDEARMDMFDEIVCAAWGIDALPTMTIPGSNEDLYRFAELVLGLISHTGIKPPDPKTRGIRLRLAQRQMKSHQKHPQCSEQLKPGLEVLSETERASLNLKAVDPKVVLLLQSVAFNILFATSSSIQDIEDHDSTQLLFQSPASIHRSCAILEDYLGFESKDGFSYDSGIGMDSPFQDSMSPWMQGMRDVSEEVTRSPTPVPPKRSWHDIKGTSRLMDYDTINLDEDDTPSLGNLGGDAIAVAHAENQMVDTSCDHISSNNEDIFDMEISPSENESFTQSLQGKAIDECLQASPDEIPDSQSMSNASDKTPEFHSAAPRKKSGIKCDACGRLFSNKGNRNKHKKTACPKSSKLTFLCRYHYLGCTRETTTEWYRGAHEEQRCKFNPNSKRNMERSGGQ